MAYPFLMGIGDSASPGYAAFNSSRHQLSGIARKGRARAPYEFGVKVSLTTTNRRCKGGEFILHAKAPPGNPYDGHTLKNVLEETEALTGREIERAHVDIAMSATMRLKPNRVYRSGQKRGVHCQIKKELRRRSAIEPVIGHCKTDGHLSHSLPRFGCFCGSFSPSRRQMRWTRLAFTCQPSVLSKAVIRR